MERNEKECLINLLLDIESKEFKDIEKQANAVNIFNVLKLVRTEIRHSNMLAWLLDPNENHGLGSAFCRYFLSEVFNENKETINNKDINLGKLLLESLDNFIIYRERFNIDILLVADNQLICIENKIDTGEHDEQLNKYENILLNNEFKDYEKLFLYLTPNDEDISKYPRWHKVSYGTVTKAIQKILDNFTLNDETHLLTTNYKTVLERSIMNETTEIEKLCTDIYKKHKTALDLIFEYRPDNMLTVFEEISNFLQARNDIVFDKKLSSKQLIRFTTKEMENLFPTQKPNTQSLGWNNGYPFMYEINLYGIGKGGAIIASAVLSHYISEDILKTQKLEEQANKAFAIAQKYTKEFRIKKNNKLNDKWQFAKVFNRELANEKKNNGELSDLISKVTTSLTSFIEKDIKNFETILQKELS